MRLTPEQRAALPDSAFAIPEKRKYPIHDREHALAALGLVEMHGTEEEQRRVRRAVFKKYPDLKPDDKEKKANVSLVEQAIKIW